MNKSKPVEYFGLMVHECNVLRTNNHVRVLTPVGENSINIVEYF